MIILLFIFFYSLKLEVSAIKIFTEVHFSIDNAFSPILRSLSSIARNKLANTAEEVGIPWNLAAQKVIKKRDWKKEVADIQYENPTLIIPLYYKKRFHAYVDGNLCIEAAVEQEIASAAVGARNFPSYGVKGEEKFRSCFDEQFIKLGGVIENGGTVLDMGWWDGHGIDDKISQVISKCWTNYRT
mmetsp:Transcript_35628/g.36334  ORF Transcript_35628/g.36334 Transcript_35628/m.36334 type:complete len:185 (+) Transcript_35628:119-673(+)